MPWGSIPIQGSPAARLKEHEYQRYMRRCWRCQTADTVDVEDALGMCEPCKVQLRRPNYVTPVLASERIKPENREVP